MALPDPALTPVFIIPVRGGSQGLPGKNLRPVAGISLVGRAVRTARAAAAAVGGRVVVDSDDAALLAEGRRWGAETPYVRPAQLATATAPTLAVLQHAVATLGLADAAPVVLIQATSPLLSVGHLIACWRAFDGAVPVVSVAPAEHHPAWSYALDDGVIRPLLPAMAGTRRQELPPAYRLTGAVYIAAAGELRAGRHPVQDGRSRAVIADGPMPDIDAAADLVAADALAAGAVAPLMVDGRPIGPGHPCFIIAEAGVNHDGDVDAARRLIDAAAAAGADAVKFQTWRTDLLVRPGARTAAYQQAATGDADQYAMLRRLELPYDWHRPLMEHAAGAGIRFLSTPDELPSARFLAGLGLPLIKIGSAELDNLPFLDAVGRLGRPVLLSTGMGDLAEVAAAVDVLRAAGVPGLGLFHCVSDYPAPLEQMNVRAIATLRRAFAVPAGLSDHCPSPEPALAAVGVGMDIWEKHLTLDRTRPGPDHRMSLEPDQLRAQIALVRAAERALGDGAKAPQPAELPTRAVVRKRLHAGRDLAAGAVIAGDDLAALRGGDGLPVSAWRQIVGRRLRRAVAAGDPIDGEALDG